MKEHLYCRLAGVSESEPVSDNQLDTVDVVLERMYKHKVLRINYTTYDMRRSQDSVNPRTHADVMVPSDDDDHPYRYARVIGVYHVMVRYNGGASQQMDFLWVRWFGFDLEHHWGWKAKRLPQIGFLDSDYAFGFLDPASIIRAVHLLPNFRLGRTIDFLGPSIARKRSEKDQDWIRYYVGMYVLCFILDTL